MEMREEFQTRVAERKAELLEKRVEIKARLNTRAKAMIANSFSRIETHLDKVISRFEAANERIETHIDRLREKGVDVSNSVDLFARAQAQLEITTEVIADTKAAIKTELEKEDVSRDAIHALVQVAKDSIKETHEAYVDTLVSLKASLRAETSDENEVE